MREDTAMNRMLVAIAAAFLLIACASKPLVPYTEDAPPLILLPASMAGIEDGRDVPGCIMITWPSPSTCAGNRGTGIPGPIQTKPDRSDGTRHRLGVF